MWAEYLRSSIVSCGHSVQAGEARLINADDGILEIADDREGALRIAAGVVIWATGTLPWADAPASSGRTVVYERVIRVPTARLQVVVPSDRSSRSPRKRDGSWTMQLGSREYRCVAASDDPGSRGPDSDGWRRLFDANDSPRYARNRCVRGRVLLVGGSAGLVNRFTGEGISYALTSGRLAGEAASTGRDTRVEYLRLIGGHFGTGEQNGVVASRRHRLALRALDGALTEPSAARRRLVGLMLDQGDAEPTRGEVMSAAGHATDLQMARVRVQVVTAREAGRLWLDAAPSLARVPALPDVRL